MRTIAFITTAKKDTIEIPKKYQGQFHGEIRVIILQETAPEEVKSPAKKRKLTAVKIKTKGLIFNRDEANER